MEFGFAALCLTWVAPKVPSLGCLVGVRVCDDGARPVEDVESPASEVMGAKGWCSTCRSATRRAGPSRPLSTSFAFHDQGPAYGLIRSKRLAKSFARFSWQIVAHAGDFLLITSSR